MIKILSFASAALLGLAQSNVAVASDAKDAAPTSAVATPSAPADAPQAREQKYCVVETVTGSRIPLRTCKTRRQWMAQGFDPLNP
jgi:hypothetical protein